ncbi:probable 28S rRNA (cytosine(4447)-C(5))-methyltransferase isoform X2 [Portunus trituberculatus]|uniref:probable 28S rRNA (cytosine(4447)-C(5))-methyltransferase isoform X2 n=1 Tax=Portunus trituberculatus TaxID=210409 RepID=UPI001E1D0823|nr:probable 28S rRNA (cytosine(4447)-C(5))-methyltransferase isoform X2 [Portunus trituberculatus]
MDDAKIHKKRGPAGQRRGFWQGHQGKPRSRHVVCAGRGDRRARVMRGLVLRRKASDYDKKRSLRERHLFKKMILYETDKVDDLIEDFGAMLQVSPTPLLLPGPSTRTAESHYAGLLKTLRELSEESGFNELMLGYLTQVMGRQEAQLTLQAISFTPPVTFLRTNTLKISPKKLWQELVLGGVSAWLPRWSSVTMLALDNPASPRPLIRKMILDGKCSQQKERQWQELNVPVGRSAKGRHEQPKGKATSVTGPGTAAQSLTLFYSACGSISSLVVMVVAAKAREDVLELCATNSGKTLHIAMQMNSGRLVANTLHREEVQAMRDTNTHHDVQNCVVTCIEPALLAKSQAGRYQRVLVDAPSSGVGMVRPFPGVRVCCTTEDLHHISARQRLLLLNGADCLRQGRMQNSYLVYTTCSVLAEENEDVVQHLLEARPQFKLVPTGLGIGVPGLTHYKTRSYHEDMWLTRRLYCHHHHMQGTFIAKFVLESKVNALKTSTDKKLLLRQTSRQQDHHTSRTKREKKAKQGPLSGCKKGSHEWFKQTFIGEDGDDNYSDDD